MPAFVIYRWDAWHPTVPTALARHMLHHRLRDHFTWSGPRLAAAEIGQQLFDLLRSEVETERTIQRRPVDLAAHDGPTHLRDRYVHALGAQRIHHVFRAHIRPPRQIGLCVRYRHYRDDAGAAQDRGKGLFWIAP